MEWSGIRQEERSSVCCHFHTVTFCASHRQIKNVSIVCPRVCSWTAFAVLVFSVFNSASSSDFFWVPASDCGNSDTHWANDLIANSSS